jgi:hypothetical protein
LLRFTPRKIADMPSSVAGPVRRVESPSVFPP